MLTKLKHLLIGKFSPKRLIRTTTLIVLLSYLGLIFFACMFADKIIFQPPAAGYRDTSEIIKLNTNGAQRISAMYLPNESASYTILYSHGNAEDLGTVKYKLEELRELGFAVMGYDYEGYGTSEGVASEGATRRDIDAAYGYLTRALNIPPNRIILYGWSLGGAVAADLAAREAVAGLVLEGTFVSAFRVVTRAPILPFDRFRTLSKLKRIRCPILVVHGDADQVIAFWHGQKLYEEANEPKQHLWVKGGRHGDLAMVANDEYRGALQNFVRALER